jgi:hypothetical protein
MASLNAWYRISWNLSEVISFPSAYIYKRNINYIITAVIAGTCLQDHIKSHIPCFITYEYICVIQVSALVKFKAELKWIVKVLYTVKCEICSWHWQRSAQEKVDHPLFCDQKPTTHIVQGNCFLFSKGLCVSLAVWPCAYKESTNFPDSPEPLRICGDQKSAIKQVPYQRCTNIGHHWPKFSWHYNLVPRICASLPMTKASNISFNCRQLLKYLDITLLSIYGTSLLQIIIVCPFNWQSCPCICHKGIWSDRVQVWV